MEPALGGTDLALSTAVTKLLLPTVLFATGCLQVQSLRQETENIDAFIRVLNEGGDTNVYAALWAGPLDEHPVSLSTGDRLVAHARGQALELDEQNGAGSGLPHVGDFQALEPGTLVRVAFERERHVSAPRSEVLLPEAPEILEPAPKSKHAEGDLVHVAWEVGVIGRLSWSLTGPCIDDVGGDLDNDTDTMRIPITMLGSAEDEAVTCPAVLEFRRESRGRLDTAYEGGRIRGIQSRSVELLLSSQR